jgi:hypothetical protein
VLISSIAPKASITDPNSTVPSFPNDLSSSLRAKTLDPEQRKVVQEAKLEENKKSVNSGSHGNNTSTMFRGAAEIFRYGAKEHSATVMNTASTQRHSRADDHKTESNKICKH